MSDGDSAIDRTDIDGLWSRSGMRPVFLRLDLFVEARLNGSARCARRDANRGNVHEIHHELFHYTILIIIMI